MGKVTTGALESAGWVTSTFACGTTSLAWPCSETDTVGLCPPIPGVVASWARGIPGPREVTAGTGALPPKGASAAVVRSGGTVRGIIPERVPAPSLLVSYTRSVPLKAGVACGPVPLKAGVEKGASSARAPSIPIQTTVIRIGFRNLLRVAKLMNQVSLETG